MQTITNYYLQVSLHMEVKFHKVSALPATPEPGAIYFRKQGGRASLHVSDNAEIPALVEVGTDRVAVSNASGVFTELSGITLNWLRTVTTTGAAVEIYVTSNGLVNGTPLFANLNQCIITPIVIRNTTSDSSAPWVYIKTINTSTNLIQLQIKQSNSASKGGSGNYFGNVNNTTSVELRLQISGIQFTS